EDVAPLLSQSGLHGEHSSDELAARYALGAEARLSPENPVSHSTFSRVVGGLDAVLVHEVPEGAADSPDLRACAGCLLGMLGRRALGQQCFDTFSKWSDVLSEGLAAERSVSNAVPPKKELLALFQQGVADALRLAAALGDRGEVTDEMAPTNLASPEWPPVIAAVAIADQHPLCLTKERFRSGRAAGRVDLENRHEGGHCCPEPHPAGAVAPARFVGVFRWSLRDVLLRLGYRYRQGLACDLLVADNRAQRDPPWVRIVVASVNPSWGHRGER